MTWIESKNECLAIKADLPYITLKDQNKEIGDFPGVILIFDVSGCQVIKFATNPESQPALGLIQTNHSMPVSPHHGVHGDDHYDHDQDHDNDDDD